MRKLLRGELLLLVDDLTDCLFGRGITRRARRQVFGLVGDRTLQPAQLRHRQTAIDYSLGLVAIGVADFDVQTDAILKITVDQIAQDEVEHKERFVVRDAAFSNAKRDLSLVVRS
jgi:hypothetical protein